MVDEDGKLKAERIEAYGISEDGKMVRLQMSTDEDGGAIFLTMPSVNLPEFHREIGNLLAKLKAGGMVQPGVGGVTRTPRSWTVGNHPDAPGHTMLMFDRSTPEETVYALPDMDALNLADGIERNVFSHMSMADRRRLILERQKAAQQQKLILPGQPGYEVPN